MWKKVVLVGLKFGISFSILGYLFFRTWRDESFGSLVEQPKNWELLLLAFCCALSAVSVSFYRWYLLIRALGLNFSLKDAFRLGFLGYLLNFFTLGVVGGDLLKTVFVVRQHRGKGPEAAASVVMDRSIGLYALFLTAAVAYVLLDTSALNARDPGELAAVERICQVSVGLVLAGAAALTIMMLPGVSRIPLKELLARTPKIGGVLVKLIAAVRTYRRRYGVLLIAGLLSLGIHILNTLSIFLIAHGLPGGELSLGSHFVIVPIAMVANAVPLPGGLGALEFALDFLYRSLSSAAVAKGQGFIIALAFRVGTILIAMVGMGYYLTSRREVEELIHEAQLTEEDNIGPPPAREEDRLQSNTGPAQHIALPQKIAAPEIENV